MENTRLQFIYVYDALCGWCYGFSPILKALFERHQKNIDFEVIAGGMVMGDQAGPVGEKADFLLNAYPAVEERTGVTFGQAWVESLKEGKVYYDSYPSAIALEAVKQIDSAQAVPFAAAIQKAIYQDGKEPASLDTFLSVIRGLGLSESAFSSIYQEESIKDQVKSNFMYSRQLNVQGFPAAFLRNGDQYWMIAKGYRPMDHMEPLVSRFIKDGKL